MGVAGFGGARAGRPQAPRPRQRPALCGWQTASPAWDGTAHLLEQRNNVRGSGCCLAPTLRRSLWRTCSDTVCASSRNGCLPAARNTSGGVYPGRGVEE